MVGGERGAGMLGNITGQSICGKEKCCITNCQKLPWAMRKVIGLRWGGGMDGCTGHPPYLQGGLAAETG